MVTKVTKKFFVFVYAFGSQVKHNFFVYASGGWVTSLF